MKLLVDEGFDINPFCGGRGVCGKCKVKITGGLPEPNRSDKKVLSPQELQEGHRLSCQFSVGSDIEIVLDEDGEITGLTTGVVTETEIKPAYKKGLIHLEKPVLEDPRDFARRVHDELGTETITLQALKELDLVNKKKPITVLSRAGEIVGFEPGDTTDKFFGLAIDIGTTVVVVYLLDLNSGEEVDVQTFYNPQRRFGADVISRVNHSIQNKDGVQQLQEILLEGINSGIARLCERNEIQKESILTTVIVGNTIMLHTLTGINADSIARIPYIPVFADPVKFGPGELDLEINSRGEIHLLPSISGYIGADVIADMLAVDFHSLKGSPNMLIDIGTNGEIVLGNRRGIVGCSTAAGPAFEGANITCGMAGTAGAVSEFSLEEGNEASYKTIDRKPARGICGSGLLDIVAELRRWEFIKPTGAFYPPEEMTSWKQSFMTEYNGSPAFRVVGPGDSESGREIILAQKDIREVQLAKGAIAAGISILMEEVGLELEEIGTVFLAGGFGNYLNPASAAAINMLPPVLEEKVLRIGNAAGAGAKLALLNKDLEKQSRKIKEITRYVELSVKPEFQARFVSAMEF